MAVITALAESRTDVTFTFWPPGQIYQLLTSSTETFILSWWGIIPRCGGQCSVHALVGCRFESHLLHPQFLPLQLVYEEWYKTTQLLISLFIYFFSYIHRPKYRYPFYDGHGNGELLYGYGGPRLYEYRVFQPVEGYYRR